MSSRQTPIRSKPLEVVIAVDQLKQHMISLLLSLNYIQEKDEVLDLQFKMPVDGMIPLVFKIKKRLEVRVLRNGTG